MNFAKQRFVSLPYLIQLSDKQLQYTDILTYTVLKSFNNHEDDLCYPTQETVSERSATPLKFVRDSLKRLELSGLIRIKKSTKFRKPNKYWFNDITAFNRVPYDFFDIKDLTASEKSILLCLYQFFITKGRKMPKTMTSYAAVLGVGIKTIERYYIGLVKKGYIDEDVVCIKGEDRTYCTLTNKINWIFPINDAPPTTIDRVELTMC